MPWSGLSARKHPGRKRRRSRKGVRVKKKSFRTPSLPKQGAGRVNALCCVRCSASSARRLPRPTRTARYGGALDQPRCRPGETPRSSGGQSPTANVSSNLYSSPIHGPKPVPRPSELNLVFSLIWVTASRPRAEAGGSKPHARSGDPTEVRGGAAATSTRVRSTALPRPPRALLLRFVRGILKYHFSEKPFLTASQNFLKLRRSAFKGADLAMTRMEGF